MQNTTNNPAKKSPLPKGSPHSFKTRLELHQTIVDLEAALATLKTSRAPVSAVARRLEQTTKAVAKDLSAERSKLAAFRAMTPTELVTLKRRDTELFEELKKASLKNTPINSK